jgi:hypothetical protein
MFVDSLECPSPEVVVDGRCDSLRRSRWAVEVSEGVEVREANGPPKQVHLETKEHFVGVRERLHWGRQA